MYVNYVNSYAFPPCIKCIDIINSQFSDLISNTYLLVLTAQSNRPLYTYYCYGGGGAGLAWTGLVRTF